MRKLTLAVALALAAFGQGPAQQFTFVRPGSLLSNSGAPYSADEVHEHSKRDAGGKLVAEPAEVRHVYRDGQGRKRIETPVGHSNLFVAEIEDPVGGFKIVLDPQARVAHRTRVEKSSVYPIAARAVDSRPVGSQQPLGTRTFEGLQAIGTRTVVDLRDGQSVIEMWTAPELSILVLVQNTLPRAGVFITRTEHIRRNEPDPMLFSIPPDYKVIDETGTFSFTIGGSRR